MQMLRWQPMSDLFELSNLLDRRLRSEDMKTEKPAVKLSLDIYETEDALTLRATLPGVQRDDIRIEFEDQILTVSAEIREHILPEGAKPLLRESSHGKVTRSLRIPHRIDLEKSKATYQDGVLQVVFPKSVEARRRTITIE